MKQKKCIEEIMDEWKNEANLKKPIYINKQKRTLYVVGDYFSLSILCGTMDDSIYKKYKRIIRKNTPYKKIVMIYI